MRHQLRPLIDRKVIYSGRVKEYRKQPDDSMHLLIVNVKVYPYSKDIAYGDEMCNCKPIAKLDHSWVQIRKDGVKRVGMLAPTCAVAKVMQYARANGSIDYGFRLLPSLLCENTNLQLHRCLDNKEAVQLMRDALAITDDEAHLFGLHHSANEWLAHWEEQIKYYERLEGEKEASRVLASLAPNNGPCKRLNAVLSVPKQRLVQSRGFA